MQKNFVMRGLTFVSVLCLTLSILAATSLRAEELKPFLTLKVASPETLLSVAEKIAQFAGTTQEYQDAVAPFKDLSGLTPEGPIGLVLQSNGKEIKEPILVLPVKDISAITIPGTEMITAGLKKLSDGKYVFNSPAGNYILHQKKDYLFVVSEDSTIEIPNDPKKLLAGLENYTLGIKIDFENTTLDSIEAILAMPQMILAMQGGQQATQAIEQFNEAVAKIYEEFRSMTIGISFDPKTADTSITSIAVPKKGSQSEKQYANFRNAKTAFGGFLGKGDVIFSLGGSSVETPSPDDIEITLRSVDQLLNAALAQIEEQSESDEDVEFGTSVVESIRKIIAATLKQGKSDFAASLDGEGTFLLALTLGETAELESLGTKIFDRVKKDHEDAEVTKFLAKNLKANSAITEGFKVSSLKIPVAEIAAGHDDIPAQLAKETLGIFWGVKDNEAVVLAFGLNFDKAEKAFNDAVGQTKSLVSLKQPIGVFALQPLGKLLKKYSDPADPISKAFDILASAGNDAKLTVTSEAVDGSAHVKIFLSGKVITALVNVAKNGSGSLDRSQIKDF